MDLRFEMDRLLSYDRESILAEIRRVAELVEGPLTRAAFDQHARVDSSTVVRRVGTWREALESAGLGDRYAGRRVTPKMRAQRGRFTDEEIIEELRAVARELGVTHLTMKQLAEHSKLIGWKVVTRRFGSWAEGLRQAGLDQSPRGRRWTDDDYFENLLAVWTHYGRPPTYAEMDHPPSRITANGYAKKFGTWTKAKHAFVERVNADLAAEPRQPEAGSSAGGQLRLPDPPERPRPKLNSEDRRTISLGLRYKVLSRDRFRCSTCGRSPATDLDVRLHVDHVIPVAAGGKTVEENLRALCADCNLGKGATVERG